MRYCPSNNTQTMVNTAHSTEEIYVNASTLFSVTNLHENKITVAIDENRLDETQKRAMFNLHIDNRLITLSIVYGTLLPDEVPAGNKYLIQQILDKSGEYQDKTKQELLVIALVKLINDCAFNAIPDKNIITQLSILLPLLYPDGKVFDFEDEIRQEFVKFVLGKILQASMLDTKHTINYDLNLLEDLTIKYFLYYGCEPGFFGRILSAKYKELEEHGMLASE